MDSVDKINTISVIGSGTMGREIAQTLLLGGFPHVILHDIKQECLEDAFSFIEKGLQKLDSKGKLTKNRTPEDLLANLHLTTEIKSAVSGTDFVIEAIPEVLELKKDLFTTLGTLTPPDAILATNTSTMSITEIANASSRPEKVIGMHFFTPIPVLSLIEVIKGTRTSQKTMDLTARLGMKLPCFSGKRSIARIQKESPGFIVNRLNIVGMAYLMAMLDKAYEMGYKAAHLDKDVTAIKGRAPFEIADFLGLETVYNSIKYLEENLHADLSPGKVLTSLVEQGKLGKKTGQGFYKWEGDKIADTEKVKKGANLARPDDLLAIHLNEGCRLLNEGIVDGYKIIDKAMMAGMRIPGPFNPGKRNYEQWSRRLKEIADITGKDYFLPCDLMKSGNFKSMRK
ncbi:MAG: 3-hydroxyacyl-CoA dehydrogenase NAD-binding domain-containing protein [Promethearchaeia archaeon]